MSLRAYQQAASRAEAPKDAEYRLFGQVTRALMAAAEAGRSGYRRLADRAAGLYAPVVHSAALLSFIGWAGATGDLHRAATIAVAVLIITCPCALGLAVPIVQVIAARRLFERGIMVKDGTGLERLAEIDTVVFDKTGTLTTGRPELDGPVDGSALALAAALAARSSHPYAQALASAHTGAAPATVPLDAVHEIPGHGLEAHIGGDLLRLGRADWALAQPDSSVPPDRPATVLSRNGMLVARYPLPATTLDMSGYILFTKYLKEAPAGTYRAETSPMDGVRRVVAYRRVEGTPFIAVAAADYEFLIQPFRQTLLMLGVVASGLTVMGVASGLLAGTSLVAALAFSLLFGAGNGLATIVRGTQPLILFDLESYGFLTGWLITPSFFISAAAPVTVACLADTYGAAIAIILALLFALSTLISAIVLWIRFR